MPASPALIRRLTIERLSDVRPRFAPVHTNDADDVVLPPPLARLPIDDVFVERAIEPAGSALSSLDNGRVSLRDAARIFGWNASTSLSFSTDGKCITVTSCASTGTSSTLSDVQGRSRIPLAIRRRLGINDGDGLLVITMLDPTPHVNIYTMTQVLTNLSRRKDS